MRDGGVKGSRHQQAANNPAGGVGNSAVLPTSHVNKAIAYVEGRQLIVVRQHRGVGWHCGSQVDGAWRRKAGNFARASSRSRIALIEAERIVDLEGGHDRSCLHTD